MKTTIAMLLVATTSLILSSCVTGTVDRMEDRGDRQEDRYDRRTYSGPGDHIESRYDRMENRNDKARGRYGL
jgi:hypothetical protein